jgi:hypothetical protein
MILNILRGIDFVVVWQCHNGLPMFFISKMNKDFVESSIVDDDFLQMFELEFS